MTIETLPWDITDHLDSEDAIAAYLEAAFEDGDPLLIRTAIKDVARARGIGQIARKTGMTLAGLSQALDESASPSFDTVAAILRALGLRLAIAA